MINYSKKIYLESNYFHFKMLVKPDTTTITLRQKSIDGKELLPVNLNPTTQKELDSTLKSLVFFKRELAGLTLEKLDIDIQIKRDVIMCVDNICQKLELLE